MYGRKFIENPGRHQLNEPLPCSTREVELTTQLKIYGRFSSVARTHLPALATKRTCCFKMNYIGPGKVLTGAPESSKSGMSTDIAPKDFIHMSAAIEKLSQGMFGGLPRPPMVKAAIPKLKSAKLPKWGPWDDRAAKAISIAVKKAELTLFAFSSDLGTAVPLTIPILSRIITSRGRLPDVGVRLYPENPARYAQYTRSDHAAESSLDPHSILVLKAPEFSAWYNKQRRKKTWASQKTANKKGANPRGRPRLDRFVVIIAIEKLLNEGSWIAKMGIPRLGKALSKSNPSLEVGSQDTLARIVRNHYLETGDPAFQVPKRRRGKKLPQKSTLKTHRQASTGRPRTN